MKVQARVLKDRRFDDWVPSKRTWFWFKAPPAMQAEVAVDAR